MGVQARAPEILKNLSRLSQTKRAITTVKATIKVRFKFLHHYLIRDLGQPAYRYPSITAFAGYIIKGYEKIRLKQNKISTTQMKGSFWGKDEVISGFSLTLSSPNENIQNSENAIYRTKIKSNTYVSTFM